ncbi:Threonine/homoserine efflux transporter RhtA [Jannaschia faecimaris]|uniref:Threonine/homoserine efflux transporter RhtA n=1 Tax=Jannaschia faecimaris TaxID=1244108 RepID=A0A1H3N1L7_9RHOB|nr:EamA family transporter [Jannaschia faecimaris]SDY82807.1 Threonine/homoserine efflux transporter RhtA [Jannaschia faecimaris]
MTAGVFMAVMGAAFLHAAWNGLIKSGASKVSGIAILTVVQGAIAVVIAQAHPLPTPQVWPWLLASGAFHAGYKLFLAFAYEQGDLSRVYPIARGAAPMVVLLVSPLLLSDIMTTAEVAGVLLLGCGIAAMAAGSLRAREARRLVPYALGSALMTAGYTIVDGSGARVALTATQYVAWLFILDVVIFSPVITVLRGSDVWRASPRAWGIGAIAAALSYGAYAIAVWAMTVAPIALVGALRETSILFAVLIGWIVLGETVDRWKAVAAVVIVAGVALTRL